jgi:hypothetical protein
MSASKSPTTLVIEYIREDERRKLVKRIRAFAYTWKRTQFHAGVNREVQAMRLIASKILRHDFSPAEDAQGGEGPVQP